MIKEFTGIDDPYEEPTAAEVVIDTTELSAERAAQKVVDYLRDAGFLEWSHQSD